MKRKLKEVKMSRKKKKKKKENRREFKVVLHQC